MANIIEDKSFQFAIKIVKLCQNLQEKQKEFVLSKQLLRSGTSIGANVAEAEQAQSVADFVSKMSIALKEAAESKYWLKLLTATNYLSQEEFKLTLTECTEIEKILVSIIKKSKLK